MTKGGEKDGGPAFAAAGGNSTDIEWQVGMSLRDYFAAKAMEGILASCPEGMTRFSFSKEILAGWAEVSYRIANEMLKARES